MNQGWSTTTAAKPATPAPSPSWWRAVRPVAFVTSWTPMLVVKKPSISVPNAPAANRAPGRDVNFAQRHRRDREDEHDPESCLDTERRDLFGGQSHPAHQHAGNAPVENAGDDRHHKTETDTYGHDHVAPPWSR